MGKNAMKKQCSFCKAIYKGDISNFFAKDRSRADGFNYRCKICKKNSDKNRNRIKKANRQLHGQRAILRGKAKEKFNGMYSLCSVLMCNGKAELHHAHYYDNSFVVPLCRDHHSLIHIIESDKKEVLEGYTSVVDENQSLFEENNRLRQRLQDE